MATETLPALMHIWLDRLFLGGAVPVLPASWTFELHGDGAHPIDDAHGTAELSASGYVRSDFTNGAGSRSNTYLVDLGTAPGGGLTAMRWIALVGNKHPDGTTATTVWHVAELASAGDIAEDEPVQIPVGYFLIYSGTDGVSRVLLDQDWWRDTVLAHHTGTGTFPVPTTWDISLHEEGNPIEAEGTNEFTVAGYARETAANGTSAFSRSGLTVTNDAVWDFGTAAADTPTAAWLGFWHGSTLCMAVAITNPRSWLTGEAMTIPAGAVQITIFGNGAGV